LHVLPSFLPDALPIFPHHAVAGIASPAATQLYLDVPDPPGGLVAQAGFARFAGGRATRPGQATRPAHSPRRGWPLAGMARIGRGGPGLCRPHLCSAEWPGAGRGRSASIVAAIAHLCVTGTGRGPNVLVHY